MAAGDDGERVKLEVLNRPHRGVRPGLALPAPARPQPLLAEDETPGDLRRDTEWRGIGKIENSGLVLRKEFEEKDAAKKHEDLYASALEEVQKKVGKKNKKRCICAAILTGKAKPSQCPNFRKDCSPKSPAGPCMVSQEGMCYNWFRYSREGGSNLA